MTILIIVLTAIVALIGVSTAIWSIVNTRKKFYNDFLERKSNGKH